MNEQINRALFLGCFLMMLVFAFSAFFSAYRDYEAYASRVRDYTGPTGVAMEESYDESNGYMKGYDVVNLILARRHADREQLMGELYHDPADPPAVEEYPELMIDGESYQDYPVEDIEPNSAFESDTVFDSCGRPVRIEIRGR